MPDTLPHVTANTSSPDLADDILHGGAAIAEFLGVSNRRAFYLLENHHVPSFKLGRTWCARKSRILATIEEAETPS